ncbi:MAG: BMC domain-containing protein [Clostridium sp.]|uniref:BMC domain-containing protein n=1 Tax=Clostridium sp. TaxID=1506 RepID=UPI002FCC5D0A
MKQAIGIVETKSLVAAIQASDTMVKAADVHVADFNYVGSGIVAVIVSGEVAAVTAAVESAQETVSGIAQIISATVIARPHDEVDKMINQ